MMALALLSTAAFGADELPKSEVDEPFEVEPPMLIPYRGDEEDPAAVAQATPVPVGLARLERDFERAKRNAGSAEHLFKIGVLAKVEIEQRTLRMIRLQAEVESARLALAREEFAVVEKGLAAGDVSPEEFKQAQETLARATAVSQAAAEKQDEAEVKMAESNLQRQRKLLSLGSGRKSEVARAEQKLAELKAQKN